MANERVWTGGDDPEQVPAYDDGDSLAASCPCDGAVLPAVVLGCGLDDVGWVDCVGFR